MTTSTTTAGTTMRAIIQETTAKPRTCCGSARSAGPRSATARCCCACTDRREQPQRAGRGELDAQPGLADGGGVRGQVRRVLRAYQGQGSRHAAANAGNGYLPEQHRGAGRGIAQPGHPERVLRRQRRQRGQQAGVHIACPELRGVWPGEPDARVPEQLGSRRPARGEVGPQRGAVGGRPAGLDRAHLDPGTARTEARDQRGRVPAGQLAAGRRGDRQHAGAARAGRRGPQRHQPARGDALFLQRRAHAEIARDDRAAAHLTGDPGGRLALRPGRQRWRASADALSRGNH